MAAKLDGHQVEVIQLGENQQSVHEEVGGVVRRGYEGWRGDGLGVEAVQE